MGIPTIAKCISGTARSNILYPFHHVSVTPKPSMTSLRILTRIGSVLKNICALGVSRILLSCRFVSVEQYVHQQRCYKNILGDPLTHNKKFKPDCSVLFRTHFCPNKGKFQSKSRGNTSIQTILYLVYCPMQTTLKSL